MTFCSIPVCVPSCFNYIVTLFFIILTRALPDFCSPEALGVGFPSSDFDKDSVAGDPCKNSSLEHLHICNISTFATCSPPVVCEKGKESDDDL